MVGLFGEVSLSVDVVQLLLFRVDKYLLEYLEVIVSPPDGFGGEWVNFE